MAGMSPYQYFVGFLCEDFQEWEEDRSSIRKSFHVALSAFHLADHYFRYNRRHSPEFAEKYKKKDGLNAFHEALAERAPSFRVIQNMTNAYKHLYTWDECSIASTGAIEIVTWKKGVIPLTTV